MEEITYKGYTIKISQDTHPSDPRRDWDNLGTIYGKWGEGNFSDIEVNNNWEDTKDHLNKHYIWLPVYGYEHGGRTVKTTPFGSRWDSGLMGVIAISKDAARKEYGRLTKNNVEKIERCLLGEVETFDNLLTGNVWGYEVSKDDEDLNSCWDYFGDWDNKEYGPLTEAKSVVDYYISLKVKERISRVKQWIQNKVPLHYRQELILTIN